MPSSPPSDLRLDRIAFVGNHVPRRCGIATFTRDLRDAVAARHPRADCFVVAMNDAGRSYDYPAEVRFACDAGDAASLRAAADFLNLSSVDVISLQHEFGIFGGTAGSHVLELLRHARAPVHTTLHTVLARPSVAQRTVMEEICRLSRRLAVMTDRGRQLLHEVYDVPDDRIDVIPHGIPAGPLVDPAVHKAGLGLAEATVLLTFGLLSPNKGIEHVISALPRIVARHPRTCYVVLGATHPQLLREQGECYRDALVRLAVDRGIRDHVVFHDRYVEMPELLAFIGAADVYITPYLGEDQITSGTLAYAFGSGTPVVSTPYWHARELLADDRGMLVPFRDADAIAGAVCDLLDDTPRRRSLAAEGWRLGREMVWDRVAERYAEAFARARGSATVRSRQSGGSPARLPPHGLPEIRLDHLARLTDDTGILQHATQDVPNRSEGYCTDDNARALTLLVRLEALGCDSAETRRLTSTYAAFVGHAFMPDTGRFRNFLGWDRRWLDERGSDDCLGRAIVALAACIGRSRNTRLQHWAVPMVVPALRAAVAATSPRGWALAAIGLRDYLHRLSGDLLAVRLQRTFIGRLVDLQRANAATGWPWIEDVVAYENARVCEALVSSGATEAVAVGLEMLTWLTSVQRSEGGRFTPIGCRGFFRRGGRPAAFDQQPIEAEATIAACLAAFEATREPHWLDLAWNAFDWFQGHNILGIALADPHTGGCRDGLMPDRTNENRGAESTLAYLSSLAAMRQVTASGGSRRPSWRSRPAPA
jgi:glycosyltransferase involved in cell wall biosynthesis